MQVKQVCDLDRVTLIYTIVTDYMLSEKFLEFFRTVSLNVDKKEMYLPYKLTGLSGIIQRLPSVYGSKSGKVK